jgi:hypothetical protein
MPIRPAFRPLYPPHWPTLSRRVRFERAGGRCQGCARPHLAQVRCLPDGRWFDEAARTWRNRRGRPARWPDLIDAAHIRLTRVVLAAAHLDNNPANNRLANLRSLCQRCHMLHDRPYHLAQRWLTYRRRWALGDLFLGLYGLQTLSPGLSVTTGQAAVSLGRAFGRLTLPRTGSQMAVEWCPSRDGGRATAWGSAGDLFKQAR